MIAYLLLAFAVAQQPDITFESLLAEMTDPAAIAEFPDPPYTCRQFSSYDRASITPDEPDGWFANNDRGQFLRFEQRDGRREAVMMDAAGPGAIVRIWSANAKGTIRIYLDETAEPALEMPMAHLLGGQGPIGEPLSAVRSRGWNCYLPIPYAKRCIVTCDDPDGLYYQINYRTWPDTVVVEPFDAAWLEDKAEAIALASEVLLDPQPSILYRSRLQEGIEPGGQTRLFHMSSQGAIGELWLRLGAPDIDHALRYCILIAEFDGAETVRCPLGDFFGTAPGLNAYRSLPMTIQDDGTLISRWFMPFERSGELRVLNLGEEPVELTGWIGSTDHLWSSRTMHFHARWRGEGPVSTQPRRDFTYATIHGQGVWAGDALHVSNPTPAWWGEGDEKIYVDGDTFPSHFGTGTEDYYGYAWADPTPFSAPFHSQTRCDGPGNFGLTSLNRFRALDAIPFTRWLRFDMEIWHWLEVPMHVAATSYFYARPGVRATPLEIDPASLALPDPSLHVFRRAGAIEAEAIEIVRRTDGARPQIQIIGDGADGTWSAMRQLFVQADRSGESVTLHVPVERAGRHEVILHFTRSWDYGILQCALDGTAAGDRIDTYHVENPEAVGVPVPHSLGVHELTGDGFDLTITCIGSHAQAKAPGVYWGLDCVVLREIE